MTTRPRIVSLIPSATEMVHALGFGDQLVGCSHECDTPPAVTKLPRLTAPKLDPNRPSGEIDRQVRDLLQEALAVYRVDAGLLRSLSPDVIVTQSQCEVCAVSLVDVEAAVADWTETRATIVSLEPNCLGDIWADMERLAEALDAAAAGSALVERLKDRISGIAERAEGLAARPSVACVEWLEPLMAAGNWVPELVALAGGRDPLGRPGAHAPTIGWAELRAADPDLVITMPCGFDIARTRRDLPLLTGRTGWHNLAAVEAGRVYLTDGNQYFNRPGPRVVESLEILAEILHPEVFGFGHKGSGWVEYGPEA